MVKKELFQSDPKGIEDFLYPLLWLLPIDTCGLRFKSKRFHDLETALKTTRFRRVRTEPIQPLNPTVYVKKLSHQTRHLPDRFKNRRFAFLFVTLQGRINEKDISRHICLLLRYASRFIESKIHESSKSEVKPQIKVVILQQSAALPVRF